MTLHFKDASEFLAELKQAPPDGEPVLRATVRRQLDRQTRVFAHLTVVASYVRLLARDPVPLPLVVTLETYVGQDWGPEFQASEATRARAKALLDRLATAAEELGLEFRPGVYEPLQLGPGGER
jgi:hypothetical protein